jgi:hypothetical protein
MTADENITTNEMKCKEKCMVYRKLKIIVLLSRVRLWVTVNRRPMTTER